MSFQNPTVDWAALSPELILLGGAAFVLLATLFLPRPVRKPFAAFVAAGCFIGAGIAAGILFSMDDTGAGVVADAIRRDRLAELAQVILAGSGLLAVGVMLSEPGDARRERTGDAYALLLTAVAGMSFFVGASNLMTLFLGLEWFSISLYVLTAIVPHRIPSLEAALKYLIVGSFGSAILLFGSALIYGSTGSIYFDEIARGASGGERFLFVAGLAMLIVGLGFKASAAPFHMWTPDVYEGAPTPVTAFMSAATKVAALVLTLRLMTTAFGTEADLWTIALAVIVCISLAWGNLAALVQTDVKRMLAYSSVSHAGFLLMPVAAGNALGGRALVYYLMSYAAMSVGSFAVVATRERELARPITFANMAGFGWERPLHGLAMSVFMFGFIGLPPSGLFLGKFYAFAAAYERGWTWLVIVGVAATVVSIYYYLGLVRSMWFSTAPMRVAPAGGSPPRDLALSTTILLSLAVSIATLFAAGPLLDLAKHATDFLTYPF
ncbi:MAG TPA: NADH-quinone oxidoreductase subunit N [Gaiellaceae bacterium]